MPTTMTFGKVQDYLDAILAHSGKDISASPHKSFWRDMTFAQFTTGLVPHQLCHGQTIPIINAANPVQSAFYLILQGSWCSKPQMPPDDNPAIADPAYSVALSDGAIISGQKMLDDIKEWLANGFPE